MKLNHQEYTYIQCSSLNEAKQMDKHQNDQNQNYYSLCFFLFDNEKKCHCKSLGRWATHFKCPASASAYTGHINHGCRTDIVIAHGPVGIEIIPNLEVCSVSFNLSLPYDLCILWKYPRSGAAMY